MILTRKTPMTRLTFDRLERGSLTIENGLVEGPTAAAVVAVLVELLEDQSFKSIPTLQPGEPLPGP